MRWVSALRARYARAKNGSDGPRRTMGKELADSDCRLSGEGTSSSSALAAPW